MTYRLFSTQPTIGVQVNLPFAFAPTILPSILAFLIYLLMAPYSIKNRGVPGAIPFAYACLFGMLWSLGLILVNSAVAFETKIFWHKFMVMWQLPTMTAVTCFILEYAQPGRWLTRRRTWTWPCWLIGRVHC
jgi:hypothetical protein